MSKQRFISFGVTEEQKHEIEEYVQKKRRWKTPGDLARDALWQFMARNKPGSHRKGLKRDEE